MLNTLHHDSFLLPCLWSVRSQTTFKLHFIFIIHFDIFNKLENVLYILRASQISCAHKIPGPCMQHKDDRNKRTIHLLCGIALSFLASI